MIGFEQIGKNCMKCYNFEKYTRGVGKNVKIMGFEWNAKNRMKCYKFQIYTWEVYMLYQNDGFGANRGDFFEMQKKKKIGPRGG